MNDEEEETTALMNLYRYEDYLFLTCFFTKINNNNNIILKSGLKPGFHYPS